MLGIAAVVEEREWEENEDVDADVGGGRASQRYQSPLFSLLAGWRWALSDVTTETGAGAGAGLA